MSIFTLAAFKAHASITSSANDFVLQTFLDIAEDLAAEYMERSIESLDGVAQGSVKIAVFLITAAMNTGNIVLTAETLPTDAALILDGNKAITIVSLSLLKAQANISTSDDDELLHHYLEVAQEWIGNHIGKPFEEFTTLPASLRQAAIMLASYWYEQRETVIFGVSMDSVPFGVLDLARPYREWSFTDG